MKGLDLARRYYEQCGAPMLKAEFPHLLPFLAVGFTGSGSERYGFDDTLSRDHDFEPGFCIFLPDEDTVDRRQEFLLERAYAKLPKEFEGVTRSPLSPVGGNRNGVLRLGDYFEKAVGAPDGTLSAEQWLTLPDYALAEAVNGEIFFDNYGQLTAIRARLAAMPEDIRCKRLAGNLLMMAQAGQYNFPRCLAHGEQEAAAEACTRFAQATMKVAFLLSHRYLPYYKWSFHALRTLPEWSEVADALSFLLLADVRQEGVAAEKQGAIEEVAAQVIAALQAQKLTKATCGDLEKHAYAVNDSIRDSALRNTHILAAICD